MNEEQRKAEVEKFMNYFVYINRPGADKLLEWLEQIGFFTAPASAKYHGAYAGGLVEHSNNVYRRLVKLADEEDKRQGRQFPEYAVDTIAVVALLHDVCKADAYKVEKKNQKQKDGSYDMNYAFVQSRLAAMLHIADMMATHLDERTEANE